MATELPLALIHFNHQLAGGEVGWNPPGQGPRNPNYGDMLVCASLLRQTEPGPDPVRVMFGSEVTTPVRGAIVRGSTYISRRFDYDAAIRTIESIDAPIAMVGLGVQSEGEDPGFLDDVPGARRFIELLAERTVSISVRGEFTATVLERLGADNLRVTGCPSMFYTLRSPSVSVGERLGDQQRRRLGISVHTGLRNGLFCRNAGAALRKHARVIQWALRTSADVEIFEQGVPLEYAIADTRLPTADRIAAAEEVLARFPTRAGLAPEDLVEHMVGVRSVEEWLARAADLDAMVGFRFHGNMVALTQGVPCFYYVYDSRLAEFCRLYRLPYQDVEEPWQRPIGVILEHDWDATTKAIRDCFTELVAFYEENGVRHTLTTAD